MDGMVKCCLSVSVVDMVDSGRPGWVLGGEMVLVAAEGGLESCCPGAGGTRRVVLARNDWRARVFCSTSRWRVSWAETKLLTFSARRLRSAERVSSWDEW